METLDELIPLKNKIMSYHPDCNWHDIMGAYLVAADAHKNQKRHSGEPYIIHPLSVAEILTEIKADDKTIIAGLLHDVVEDTPYTQQEIAELFGEDVALLIDGVTKLGKVKGRSVSEQKMENIRKMILAMATDIRVILVKLADRLHNMRTLQYHSSVIKQREIAKETLDIYAPLANRLGVYRFKWELEDLSLKYLEPVIYQQMLRDLASTRQFRENYINDFIKSLELRLQEENIPYQEIYGRTKNIYSIYKKIQRQKSDISKIYDILAIRVITDTVADCYGVLGVIHSLFVPVPGRFKDYIAIPKQNMYQSLHTTIISPIGKPLEVQIRTRQMHIVAEQGIAAHWQYKEGKIGEKQDAKLIWLRQMLDWQKEVNDADEFMSSMQNDLDSHEIYVFTPKGDLYELPYGSVPLDFAYRVHSEVGNRAIGARCNGKIVTFDYKLRNGDIIEIITSKTGKPSLDWLNLVKTPQAKNKIRSWFRKTNREEHLRKGQEIFEREIKTYGDLMVGYLKGDLLQRIISRFHYDNAEGFYLAIGENHLTINAVINGIKDELKFQKPAEIPEIKPYKEKQGHHGISIKGADNLKVRFAHCCNPLPGDQVIGYVTKGAGITIHRRDCLSVCGSNADAQRLIEVNWDEEFNTNFQVELQVHAEDSGHLTVDVMQAIADTKTVINTVFARVLKDSSVLVTLKIEVKNNNQFDFICNKIRKIRGVYEVRRIIHGTTNQIQTVE